MEMQSRSTRPRFWIAIQPSIVRVYKMAGLVALTAILVGLVGFLVVNIFYFFDHSWVRPVVLSPIHHRVVEASTQLSDAKLRASQLKSEQREIEGKLDEIERTVGDVEQCIAASNGKFEPPKTPSDWLQRGAAQICKHDRETLMGRRTPLHQ